MEHGIAQKSYLLALLEKWVAFESVTPDQTACQQDIADNLRSMGFCVDLWQDNGVNNLWATLGSNNPDFVFVGHTDVVPAGQGWQTSPFKVSYLDNRVMGRGVADMKGGIAAFMAAMRLVYDDQQKLPSMGIMLTGDEEGPATYGTVSIIKAIADKMQSIKYVLIAEPTAEEKTGDTIKVGRRGSLHLGFNIHYPGKHIAYAQYEDNLLHRLSKVLSACENKKWDQGYPEFPETGMQVYELNATSIAENVTASEAKLRLNFRFNPASNPDSLLAQMIEMIEAEHLNIVDTNVSCSGMPFYSPQGPLRQCLQSAICQVTGKKANISTGGGTSDGRFLASEGVEIIELGLPRRSIHQANESVSMTDLVELMQIFESVLRSLMDVSLSELAAQSQPNQQAGMHHG
jgi:succinyl-diaminopimelate desuccinylase